MKKISFYFFLFTFLSGFQTAYAQFNMRVGYNIAKIKAEKNKTLFSSFNSSEPDIESGFPDLNIVHGFEIGVRYNFGVLGFDLGYSNLSKKRNASVYDNIENVYLDRELSYSMNNLSLGIENVFDRFGFGGTLGYTFFKVKSSLGSEESIKLMNDGYLNSKFYIMWNLEGSDAICVSIRPYVEIAWQSINLGAVQDGISTTPSIPNSELNETPTLFGISFLFYNGPKPRF